MKKGFMSLGSSRMLTQKEIDDCFMTKVSSFRSVKQRGTAKFYIGYEHDEVELEVSAKTYSKLSEIDLPILVFEGVNIMGYMTTIQDVYRGPLPDKAVETVKEPTMDFGQLINTLASEIGMIESRPRNVKSKTRAAKKVVKVVKKKPITKVGKKSKKQ